MRRTTTGDPRRSHIPLRLGLAVRGARSSISRTARGRTRAVTSTVKATVQATTIGVMPGLD